MDETPQKKLEDIMKGIGGAAAPTKSLFDKVKPRAPEEPPPQAAGPEPGAAPAAPPLDARIQELEARLAAVQEKALAASMRLQEKEQAQKEMEAMFQQLRSQQRAEDTLKTERELGAKMQGRVGALEERLDKQISELQGAWMKAINEMMVSQREALKGATGPEVAAMRGDLEELRKQVHTLLTVPARLDSELARWEQARQEVAHNLRELGRVEETLKSAERILEERQRRGEEVDQSLKLEHQASVKQTEAIAAQLTALRGDLETMRMVTRRVTAVEETGVMTAHRQEELALAAQRVTEELRSLSERLRAAEDAAARQSQWSQVAGDQTADMAARLKTAEENLLGVAAGVQAVEAAAAQRLAGLETFAAAAGASLEKFSAYANQLAAKMNEFAVSLQAHMDQTDARVLQGDQRAAALEGRAAALAHDAASLHAGLTGLSEGLNALGQKLRALEDTVGARVGAVEAGWSGVALALPEEVMAKVRAELGQFRAQVDAKVDTTVAGLDSSLGMLTRAIPEGILRKMKEETNRLEATVADLKAKIEGRHG